MTIKSKIYENGILIEERIIELPKKDIEVEDEKSDVQPKRKSRKARKETPSSEQTED